LSIARNGNLYQRFVSFSAIWDQLPLDTNERATQHQ